MNKEEKELLHKLLEGMHGAAIIIPGVEDVLQDQANIEAIQYVLIQASQEIESGRPLKGSMKNYVGSALRQIALGADPAFAFKLKHGSKRKNDGGRERAITLETYLAINRDGLTTHQAFECVGISYSLCSEAIKKIYYKRKDEVEKMVNWIAKNALCKEDL